MKQILVVAAVVLLALPGCLPRKSEPDLGSYIDSVMNASFKAGQPGGVVLVARDGVPVFRKAYGLASLELGVPNRPENVFAIASMTKQFTAVSLLQQVQQGKLSLQDDIRKYLPEFHTHGRRITVEHLLTHTNGIPNLTMRPDFGPLEVAEPSMGELLQCVAKDSLLFEPGTDVSYNDYGYTLAALILERVSGTRYPDYLRKNIFDPLGMKNTGVGGRERSMPLFVSSYSAGGDTSFRPSEYFNWRWNLGMGDIVTCVDDMLTWDEALYTDKLVSQELLRKAWTPYELADGRKTNYGYGWVVAEHEGMPLIYHPGGMPGFRSLSVRIPSQHLYVVAMCNNGRTSSIVTLAMDFALRAAGKPLAKPAYQRLTTDALREYEGVYEVTFSGFFAMANQTREKVFRYVSVKDSTLISRRPGSGEARLLNVGKDLFMFEGTLNYAGFHRDEAGKIVSVDVYGEPWRMGPIRVELKTGLPLPKDNVPVAIDAKVLLAYAGKYTFAGDDCVKIHVDGARIYADRAGEIFPESETRFFINSSRTTVEFLKDAKGTVTGLVWTQLGSARAKKIY
jgi:CubicO group peptidase (beta-lactamase class C family)